MKKRDSPGVCNEKEVPTNDNWLEDASEAAENIMMNVDIWGIDRRCIQLVPQNGKRISARNL